MGLLVAGFLVAACGDGEGRSGAPAEADTGGTGEGAASSAGPGSNATSEPGEDAKAHSDEGGAEPIPGLPTFGPDGADAVVDATLVDDAIRGASPTVRGPRVFFTVANEGTDEHELEVVDGSGERRGDTTAMLPGTIVALSLELEPGAYELRCSLEADGGRPYRDLGMLATLTVA